jgi:hypothetical protein
MGARVSGFVWLMVDIVPSRINFAVPITERTHARSLARSLAQRLRTHV